MKKIVFALLLLPQFMLAQNLSVQGFVLSSEKVAFMDEPIYLLNPENNSLVKSTLTDSLGSFTFENMSTGQYQLYLAPIGFNTINQTILITETSLDLGPIYLNTKSENLQEVTVSAQKPMIEVKADKTIFNVSSSLNATGTNLQELMRKAPGVILDNSGSIILEGKTGVQIFIDGRPLNLAGQELQTYLQSIQSSTIDKIEIITQPSSKYDAAGSGGIINIIFKKDKNLGFNGSISSTLTKGDHFRNNSSLLLNYKTKKSLLYGSISNNIGKSTGFINLDRTQNGNNFNAKTESVYNENANNLRLGYETSITEKSTLSLIFNSVFNINDDFSDSRTPIRSVSRPSIDSVLIAQNDGNSKGNNYFISAKYKIDLKKERSLTFDIDYGSLSKTSDAFQPNYYYNATESIIINERLTSQKTQNDNNILSFQTDYSQTLLKGKLSTGVKLSSVQTNNVFDFFNINNMIPIVDNGRSNTFTYQEFINAAYFNFEKNIKKMSYQIGLRVENTISEGNLLASSNEDNNVKRNYLNWFPSGGLTYQMNQNNQIAVTYSKRIQRPNYASLNPFEFKIDELSFSKGNPFLQPQYIHNFKVSNTYKYTLNTAFSYSRINDFFAQITEAEGENKNFLTPQNIANQEVYNLSISYPREIKKWWSTYTSINAYISKYKSDNPAFFPITQETLSLYAQSNFSLPKGIDFEVSGWYSSPSVWSGTYVTKNIGSLNLAFQKKFLKNQLAARLILNDIFYTVPWRGVTRYGVITIDGTGGSDSRSIGLSLNYNFGNQNLKQSKKRNTSIEEEKDRSN